MLQPAEHRKPLPSLLRRPEALPGSTATPHQLQRPDDISGSLSLARSLAHENRRHPSTDGRILRFPSSPSHMRSAEVHPPAPGTFTNTCSLFVLPQPRPRSSSWPTPCSRRRMPDRSTTRMRPRRSSACTTGHASTPANGHPQAPPPAGSGRRAAALPDAPRTQPQAREPSTRLHAGPAGRQRPRHTHAAPRHLSATPRASAAPRPDRRTTRSPAARGVRGSSYEKTGGVLLSQALAGQVPSALRGLTALFGMGRGVSPSPKPPETGRDHASPRAFKTAQHANGTGIKYPSSPRPISTGLLQVLPPFQIRPINLVVYQGSYSLKGMGELISRPASRLDAFSGYPIRT